MTKTIEYADLAAEDVTQIVLWGEEWDEHLRFDDIDDAIEDHLENYSHLPGAHSDRVLTFLGFVRMPLPDPQVNAEWLLEHLLERLDEEFSDPDGDPTKPTDTMMAAAVSFVEAVQGTYKGYPCESVLRVRVPIRVWVEKHQPDWLDEKEVEGV